MSQEGSLRGVGVQIFSKERRADEKNKSKDTKAKRKVDFCSCALTQEPATTLVQNFCYYKLDLHYKNLLINLY